MSRGTGNGFILFMRLLLRRLSFVGSWLLDCDLHCRRWTVVDVAPLCCGFVLCCWNPHLGMIMMMVMMTMMVRMRMTMRMMKHSDKADDKYLTPLGQSITALLTFAPDFELSISMIPP